MKRVLLIPNSLLLVIILVFACNSYESSTNQVTSIDINKYQNKKELSTQDFEAVYKFGKSFLNDYYSYKAGSSKIDFSKYIVNDNLLKYSNKRVLVEKQNIDIKEVMIGLANAQFIHEEDCYYLKYTIVTKNSYGGGFGETVEILISNVNGNHVISDWYIRFGTGSSCFDEKFRPNATINSSTIWDNQEYVDRIFKRAGIS